MEITPKRRIISGLLLISRGRSTMLLRYKSGFSLYICHTFGDGVKAQPDACDTLPILIRLNTASCKISEYIFKFSYFDWDNPIKTALAILPTPDCMGSIS